MRDRPHRLKSQLQPGNTFLGIEICAVPQGGMPAKCSQISKPGVAFPD